VGSESLLLGENAAFVDEKYLAWLADPSSVDPSWATLFASFERPENGHTPRLGPTFRPRTIFDPLGGGAPATQGDVLAAALRQARAAQLINAYRVRGHLEADIDPLGRLERGDHPELTLDFYGLTEADLDAPLSGLYVYGVPDVTTIREVVTRLRRAYCGSFGVEFMNIHDTTRKRWLQERFETLQDRVVLSRDEQIGVLRKLADAEGFETLIQNRFPGTKRFSLEGAETLIPLLDLLLERLASRGAEELIFGMPHRGRLNVLANILGKPVRYILSEFEDTRSDTFQGSGDVKYHLGFASQITTRAGKALRLSLAFNPSHLEAVDPVVEGRVRARQDRGGDLPHHQVVPVLLHGDAAFAGQGLVAEVLNLSDLKGYRTGGTIHVIVNNQIGFTTAPKDARSTPYATDVARMLAVPIFHVNGEDPIAVAAVVDIAAEWRQTFHQDVVIDMYCYRKHGHNEGDEPSFTQPLLYEAIRIHPSPRVVYARRMVDSGDLSEADVDRIVGESRDRLERASVTEPVGVEGSYIGDVSSPLGQIWARFRSGTVWDAVDTSFSPSSLRELLTRANTLPSGFQAHRKIERLLAQRLEMVRGERPLDWAVGEQAAFATLVSEGFRVRLSGQDSGRGTFSHRHATLTNILTGEEHTPLQHVGAGAATFQVFDSMLSEAAVLGFEFGYSLDYPEALVIWEAQFGDFANGAQVIIDNFLTAAEQKWNRCSGLVMLLPHGFEGQGPEHSSARLERYLQLAAEDNIQVANCTTPASFYHLLRRQCHQRVRKPLIVMTPKSLLRHPEAVSTMDELARGGFQRVIPETAALDPAAVRRVVLCSGKVYYDLVDERARQSEKRVAIARLEQLYPFPEAEIRAVLASYPAATDVVWCQEEPRNMGAWPMVDEWLSELLGSRSARYVGRRVAASPATGSPSVHKREQATLVRAALTLN